jgi:hypothetical protein
VGAEARRARTIGAAAVVVVALVLAARYAMHARAPARTSSPPGASAEVESVAGGKVNALSSGADAAIAVGDDGLILRYRPGDPAWRAATSPVRVALFGVAQQADEAIAVGDAGTILVLDRDVWKVEPAVTTRALRAVVYTSYGAIAVGDGGTLLRRLAPGEPWRAEASGTTGDLLGACAGLRDVWIVGRGGVLVMRAGAGPLAGGWKMHPAVTTATLHAVACDGDHAAAAVGDAGALIERLDDVDWHEVRSGTTTDLFAIAAPLGTRSWLAVGAGGAAFRLAGAPAAVATGARWGFRAVTEGPLGTFLAGDGGVLRVVH